MTSSPTCGRVNDFTTARSMSLPQTSRGPSHVKSRDAGLAPSLLAKALSACDRDFGPPPRMGDLNQALNDLGVLTRGRETTSLILERGCPVREIEAVAILHEAVADRFRHRP